MAEYDRYQVTHYGLRQSTADSLEGANATAVGTPAAVPAQAAPPTVKAITFRPFLLVAVEPRQVRRCAR